MLMMMIIIIIMTMMMIRFGHETHPLKVVPPPGFSDDDDLLGAKLDLAKAAEQRPKMFRPTNPPVIESSFSPPATTQPPRREVVGQIRPSKTTTRRTPFLPPQSPNQNAILEKLGLTQEQLAYLQILQNPQMLGQLGLNLPGSQPQVMYTILLMF